ncbi:MAG: sigma-70 family RNA polymerase sigma factor [Actinobacteria bacterium]|nr:sigma-70 family RNA polymerase sigma factor [Actinomycetota bacterium]
MTDTSEKSVFQRVAIEQLPGLFALARNLTGADADAEDLVQEALLRAYRSFHTLEETAAAGRWMRVILTNVWRDGLRKRRRSPREVAFDDVDDFSLYETLVEEDPFPYSDTLHLDFLGSFSEEDVHLVLRRLPELYRAPLVLRYIEEFPTKEVARLLGTPLGTALARLHRGRKLFEKAMWDYASEADALERRETVRMKGSQ